jgi:hypothetical protein
MKAMKMKFQKFSQTAKILEALKKGARLTSLEALNRFGCMRLASRINTLKKEGYNVKGEMISNNGKHYKVYYLAEDELGQGSMF